MAADPVQLVLLRLRERGHEPKKSGNAWSCRCPAHEDRTASLSIGIGDDGRALLTCHAGCGFKAILDALGLEPRDAFAGEEQERPPTPKKGAATTFPTSDAAIAFLAQQRGWPAARWPYHDECGELLGVICRWDRTDGGKDIRPVSNQRDGTWALSGMPEPRPLYRLPEVLASDGTVYVTEGEKAADALRSLGLVVTTSAHGAKSAGQTDWSSLAGRHVVIMPDYDEAGERYADDVARLVTVAGVSSVAIVSLADIWPGMPAGGDAYDWIEYHDAVEPDAFLRMIEQLVARTPPSTIASPAPTEGPVLVCMADVEPRDIDWLWPGRVPLGRLTLLVGRPGEGKSFLTTDMAACVTTGTPWPDRTHSPKGSVILISAEDDPADTIRPRLDAHYADASKVHLLASVRRSGKDGQARDVMFTLADVAALEAALAAVPDCKLVVIDPIGSFLGGATDAHRDNEVRAVLAPIAKLAEKHGVAVLVVAHRRKSTGFNADETALGSRAFTGIARAVWHLSRDADDKERRLLLPGKNNLAREGAGLAFAIIGEPGRLSWESEPVTMTADDALAKEHESRHQVKPGPEPEALNAATEWLTTALASGPRLATELYDEWMNGEDGSKRTLQRARKSLGVKAYRPERKGAWWWKLAP